MPSEMEEYLFDLRGYLVLEKAVDAKQIEELNAVLDSYLPMERGEWKGNVHRGDRVEGYHLHNIFEMGEPFERLIDHPAWVDHVNRFVGGDDGLFIDESFADIRGPGRATGLHSGASKRRIRTQFRFHNFEFRCGQINILLALTHVGTGDGPTMVIPGSHKSNLLHPVFNDKKRSREIASSLEGVEGAIEVDLKAGDALLFVDCMAHGSVRRVNPGQRRMLIFRYGPHWGHERYGYVPSDALLARLSPGRRKIIQPLPPLLSPENGN